MTIFNFSLFTTALLLYECCEADGCCGFGSRFRTPRILPQQLHRQPIQPPSRPTFRNTVSTATASPRGSKGSTASRENRRLNFNRIHTPTNNNYIRASSRGFSITGAVRASSRADRPNCSSNTNITSRPKSAEFRRHA